MEEAPIAVFEPEVREKIVSLMRQVKGPFRYRDGHGAGHTDNTVVANELMRVGFEDANGHVWRCGSKGTWMSESERLWTDITYPRALMQVWEQAGAPAPLMPDPVAPQVVEIGIAIENTDVIPA